MPLMSCKRCGATGEPRTKYLGSFVLEVIVWLICIALATSTGFLSLLGALLFTIVRACSKSKVCGACGSTELVPYLGQQSKATSWPE